MEETIREIYCHHCKTYHPIPYQSFSFPRRNETCPRWYCPDCGTSLEQLYQEVRAMPSVADRIYCLPDRERKVDAPLDIRLLHFRHTTRHPVLFELTAILLLVLCIPVAIFLGAISGFVIVLAIAVYLFLYLGAWGDLYDLLRW